MTSPQLQGVPGEASWIMERNLTLTCTDCARPKSGRLRRIRPAHDLVAAVFFHLVSMLCFSPGSGTLFIAPPLPSLPSRSTVTMGWPEPVIYYGAGLVRRVWGMFLGASIEDRGLRNRGFSEFSHPRREFSRPLAAVFVDEGEFSG